MFLFNLTVGEQTCIGHLVMSRLIARKFWSLPTRHSRGLAMKLLLPSEPAFRQEYFSWVDKAALGDFGNSHQSDFLIFPSGHEYMDNFLSR